MSADSHTYCPKCQPELLGMVGVVDNFDLDADTDVRENFDVYTQNSQDGGLRLVFTYRAQCWTCGFHWSHTHSTPVPEVSSQLKMPGAPSSTGDVSETFVNDSGKVRT